MQYIFVGYASERIMDGANANYITTVRDQQGGDFSGYMRKHIQTETYYLSAQDYQHNRR